LRRRKSAIILSAAVLSAALVLGGAPPAAAQLMQMMMEQAAHHAAAAAAQAAAQAAAHAAAHAAIHAATQGAASAAHAAAHGAANTAVHVPPPSRVVPTLPNVAATSHVTPTLPNVAATSHVAPTVPSLAQPSHAAPTVPSLTASHAPPSVPNLTAATHTAPTVPSVTQSTYTSATQSSHTTTIQSSNPVQPCSTVTGPGMGSSGGGQCSTNGSFSFNAPQGNSSAPPTTNVVSGQPNTQPPGESTAAQITSTTTQTTSTTTRTTSAAIQAAAAAMQAAAATMQTTAAPQVTSVNAQPDAQTNMTQPSTQSSQACAGIPPASSVYPDPWQPGNLNQRYGSNWSCKMISLVPQEACQLYYKCLPCMNSNQDFYQTGINDGTCVPRATASQPASGQSSAPQPNTAPPPRSFVPQPQFVPSTADTPSTGASRAPEGPPVSWPPSAPPLSTCEGQIERGAAICSLQTGPSNSSCRPQAVRDCNCDPSTDRCRGEQACTPALQAKAKINVDWVFSNAGAKITYQLHTGMGESAFQAVESAQAHNPPVQSLLRECQGWVEAYLAGLHKQGGPCTLGGRPPGPQDCSRFSVIPAGTDGTGTPYYRVTDAGSDDQAMNVSVGFVDAGSSLAYNGVAGGSSPSYGQPQFACHSLPFTVRPPQTFTIPSISAISLQNAGGTYTCVCRTGACN
jgi:hypothetical protein